MNKNKCIYAIIEIPIFIVISWLAFTILNTEYLFGWLAHNLGFYLVLIGVTFLLLIFNKQIVSAFMSAGIAIGVFIGNYIGNMIVAFNQGKIVEDMNTEDIYRLHHHPGFEIWIGTIFLLVLIGIIVQTTSQHKPLRFIERNLTKTKRQSGK